MSINYLLTRIVPMSVLLHTFGIHIKEELRTFDF